MLLSTYRWLRRFSTPNGRGTSVLAQPQEVFEQMYRLGPHDAATKPPLPDSLPASDSIQSLTVSTGWFGGRCEPLPHAVFAPQHYEKGYAYPLLVWLHGAGDDEHQLRRVMPLISLRNYVAISPRGTSVIKNAARNAYTWRQDADEIAEAHDRVVECVRIATERFHIAPSRIFLTGYDEGGTMALRIALSDPGRFGGVASLGGRLPASDRPLCRINELRDLPLLLAVNERSEKYPQARVCVDLRLMHAAGLRLALRQYPGTHTLTALMLADVDRWAMDLVCGTQTVG